MHPNFCNRLRREVERVNAVLRAEQAKSTPDQLRVMALRGQLTWLTNALWGAEISGSQDRWFGARPLAPSSNPPGTAQ